MNYPPPWMSKAVLCEHISVSDRTVDNWVKQGILPPPKLRGGLLLWRWSEVDKWLAIGGGTVPDDTGSTSTEEKIRDATRNAINGRSHRTR